MGQLGACKAHILQHLPPHPPAQRHCWQRVTTMIINWLVRETAECSWMWWREKPPHRQNFLVMGEFLQGLWFLFPLSCHPHSGPRLSEAVKNGPMVETKWSHPLCWTFWWALLTWPQTQSRKLSSSFHQLSWLTLLPLSCFGHVQLWATLWTAAHQTPLSMGFSRQEYWSGLPYPPPGDLPDPGIEPRSFTL